MVLTQKGRNMKNLDFLEQNNYEVVELSNNELMETQGGFVLETAAVLTIAKFTAAGAGVIFASGVFVGYTNAKRP